MRLLEILQEYDFDIEYYRGARNNIQAALSRRSDHKTPPIPRMRSTPNRATPSSTELLLASGILADEWMAQLRQEYKACPYFAEVLTALGGQDPSANDTKRLRKLRTKRA